MLKFSFSAFKNDNKKIIFAKAHPKDDEEEKIFMKKNTLFHEQETSIAEYKICLKRGMGNAGYSSLSTR
uniref:Uncharacterized protein n=1 Tax=Rhizophagus irregularis (strain DAOM 181602 / DAOM 197198 / MUCL 43194) TaxID=747089 RepID=U9UGF6_RHIID